MSIQRYLAAFGQTRAGYTRCMADQAVDWRDFTVVDPAICHGRACIKGTRVMVSVLLDNLAAGLSEEEMRASYPTVSKEALQVVIGYAAELAREGVLEIPS